MKAFAVVAHDAGAANILFSLLREKGQDILGVSALFPVVSGPALQMFRRYFPSIHTYQHIESIDISLDGVITGTGWSSNLEHEARIWGSHRNIKTIAILDHWVNYASRFVRDGKEQLPDEIWVVDDWARKLAYETFQGVTIRQFDNSYLIHQIAKVNTPPLDGTLLYVLEPIRADWGLGKQGEFHALEYALQHLEIVSKSPINRILLRPHPTDHANKYDSYVDADHRIEMDYSVDIFEAINLADFVVGVESYALTIALAAGRPVFSSLPPWAPILSLPQNGILQIRHIAST